VTSVEASAFYSSGLESLTLPDSIETIGSVSFADTPINSVVIPDSVTSLGYSPFYDSAVEELQIGSAEYEGDPYLVVTGLDNMPQLKNLSLGNNVISIDSMWQTPLLETINLGESVQTIKSVNPNSSHLDSITIPNSVTQIVSSFSGNNLNLTSLTIPDSVTSITSLYGPAFSDFTATNLYIGTSSFE